jgi:hypothetical protein
MGERLTIDATSDAVAVPSSMLRQVPAISPSTPMELLSSALASGANIDVLEKLMALQDKWEASQARKAFIAAKAAFKQEAPVIIKDKDNNQYKSKYASIDSVVNSTSAVLGKHGLDPRWDVIQDGKEITVICTLSHSMGHSESVSIKSPPDASGAKNPLQQIKSTITYLKIATFEAVTGIASSEANLDDDGNAFGSRQASQSVTEQQATVILNLINEVGADTRKFCAYFKIEGVAKLPADQFTRAITSLNAKRGAK